MILFSKELFVLAFADVDGDVNKVERNSHKKYLPPRIEINNYNVLIDGRNFHDQSINYSIRKSDETRKITAYMIFSQQEAC